MSQKKTAFKWLLFPLALIYKIITGTRNTLFDLKILSSVEFDLPVISVGNITVGGTGKTPHIEYLIDLLKQDYKLAVLSRGYKRKTQNYILASEKSTVDEIGDEPKQIKSKFQNVTVAVDANRVRGINKLISTVNPNVILLDDAFQHRWVEPGLSILLIDYNRPLQEDHILPLGELRENMSERRRANVLVVTKTPTDIKPIEQRIIEKNLGLFPYQIIYFTTIKYGKIKPVYNEFAKTNSASDEQIKSNKTTILAITGIAQPEHLLKYLESFGTDLVHLTFPDHHPYSRKDINTILKKFNAIENESKIIITTEKDAVRFLDMQYIDEHIQQNLYFVPLEIGFLNNDKTDFDKHILKFITKDKNKVEFHSNRKKYY